MTSKPEHTDDDIGIEHNSIGIKLPLFGASNPRVWFTQVEAFFRFRRISSQPTMFSYVATQLPTEIASEVIDILDPMPTESPYDKLKHAVLKRTTSSDEARLQQLLSGVQLGDRTPSQLLRHMRGLVGHAKIDDSILHQLWSKCLPANMTAILAVQSDKLSLDMLAETADKIHDCFFKTSINHVVQTAHTPNANDKLDSLSQRLARLEVSINNITQRQIPHRSRSNSRKPRSPSQNRFGNSKFCYYHSRFGDNARNCRPGCTHPKSFNVQGNLNASQ